MVGSKKNEEGKISIFRFSGENGQKCSIIREKGRAMAQKLCFDVLSQTLAGRAATGCTLVVPAHQRDRLEPFWARIWSTAQVGYAVWSFFAKKC